MLRNSANELFKYISNIEDKDIVIDFKKIRSITRAFAHQYLKNKLKSQKNITDINVPSQIKPMFDIVKDKSLCIS